MSPIGLICLFAFFGTAALVGGLSILVQELRGSATDARLREIVNGERATVPRLLAADAAAELGRLGRRFRRLADWARTATNLCEQADAPFDMRGLAVASAATATVAALGCAAAAAPAPVLPPAALAGAALPTLWLIRRRARRRVLFARQLPTALELIARAMRAGHGLAPAMQAVATEMLPPISKEFAIACDAQSLGVPIDKALQGMLARVPNDDLRFFATSVRMQQRSGGNLAEILDKIARVVRERFRLLGQVKALTAEGRLSGVVLLALPVAAFAAMSALNPAYIEPLFDDPTGRKLILGATACQLFGALVIRRVTDVRV